jgi:hypothetical protein
MSESQGSGDPTERFFYAYSNLGGMGKNLKKREARENDCAGMRLEASKQGLTVGENICVRCLHAVTSLALCPTPGTPGTLQ